MSLITFELSEISVFHEKDWDMVIKLMSEVVSKFEAAILKVDFENFNYLVSRGCEISYTH